MLTNKVIRDIPITLNLLIGTIQTDTNKLHSEHSTYLNILNIFSKHYTIHRLGDKNNNNKPEKLRESEKQREECQ